MDCALVFSSWEKSALARVALLTCSPLIYSELDLSYHTPSPATLASRGDDVTVAHFWGMESGWEAFPQAQGGSSALAQESRQNPVLPSTPTHLVPSTSQGHLNAHCAPLCASFTAPAHTPSAQLGGERFPILQRSKLRPRKLPHPAESGPTGIAARPLASSQTVPDLELGVSPDLSPMSQEKSPETCIPGAWLFSQQLREPFAVCVSEARDQGASEWSWEGLKEDVAELEEELPTFPCEIRCWLLGPGPLTQRPFRNSRFALS